MLQRGLILPLTILLVTAGCVGVLDNEATEPASTEGTQALSPVTQVETRDELDFTIDDGWSHTLEQGPYGILDSVGVHVTVDMPATEGLAAATGMATIHMGIFLPEIPGCDWGLGDAQALVAAPGASIGNEDLPEACKVPVVADIGPYYASSDQVPIPEDAPIPFFQEVDTHATEPAARLGGFLIENLVPHGYAVAQVSVVGTGDSGHCMDFMGTSEQAGIDAAVEFLGEASFSNGNVGLTGRSYDGTTPWEAASTPEANDHLKTIAPISGLVGGPELWTRNGSSESRAGTSLIWALYWMYGLDGTAGDLEHLACPDALTGGPRSVAGYASGDYTADPYWAERSGFLEGALEHYDGSVYLIHGFQDWNVDPHMAFPTFEKLHEAGIETKALIGQWDHAYPDRRSNHEDLTEGYGKEAFPATVRHDWAQDMLEWFDHYLKGTGEKPQLHAEIQDNQGHWRIEQHYPPEDAEPVELSLDQAEITAGSEIVFGTGDPPLFVPGPVPVPDVESPVDETLTLELPSLSADEATRIVGMPTFHVQVTPTGPGGQLFAELRDADTGLRLGHAIMDLRYREGGTDVQPVVPGTPTTARMQFLPMDVVLPAGHGLELHVATTGMDYLAPAVNAPVQVHVTEQSLLTLPTVERGANAFFLPPGHADTLGEDGVPADAAP